MKVTIISILIIAVTLFSQTPADIKAGPDWWLEADTYVAYGDSGVSNWGNIADDSTTEAVNATEALQPDYVTIGGYRAVQFDGTDDFLDLQANQYVQVDGGEVFVVVYGDGMVHGSLSSSTRFCLKKSSRDIELRMTATHNFFLIEGTLDSISILHWYRSPDSTVSVFGERNRANPYQHDEGGAWKTQDHYIRYLGRSMNTYGGPISIFAFIVFDTTLTVDERSKVFNYLNNKYSCETPKAFYIDADGGNDGDGHYGGSTDPWQTFTRLQSQYFVFGDSLLMEKGDTLSSTLTPYCSGDTANAVYNYIGYYGSGAYPLIYGINANGFQYWKIDNCLGLRIPYINWAVDYTNCPKETVPLPKTNLKRIMYNY